MRIWERAAVDVRCGLCGDPVAAGSPVRVYVFAYSSRPGLVEKIRCAACAGESVPALLPDLPPKAPPLAETPPRPFVRFSAGMLPLDFKQRQAKDEDA